jgi:hypothetical protein
VLYPRNKSAQLDMELFRNPTAEYRGAPFWSWNSRIDLPQLLRQIDQLKSMGFGGFNIHARTGLADEYLGQAFMAAVVACTEKAAAEGMLSWLYDEDRWPSGAAGGIVTRDPQYRVKHLLWTVTPYVEPPRPRGVGDYTTAMRTEDGVLLARYEVVLDHDGHLARYRRLKDSDTPAKDAHVWYAYMESPWESPWFNNQTYVDTLSPAAIERFIETTHERFLAAVGGHFGKAVPAIFTDEPQFTKKTQFNRADETRDLFMPWTSDLPQTYRKTYKQDLLNHLPELFWNLPGGKASQMRWRYHDHTAERFATAFADTISRWCGRHGIALTGHVLGETYLASQTRGVGEAMRPLRSFHIPGIDVLCDAAEYTTAKQAQSVARQFGRAGVLSELYGVTNWDFDFVGHKAQGDWQAAMGVSVRVPHLAWVSMAGESKRDYPAAIGYQSPWFGEYPLIENHFARINTVMTRGKPLVRVGVIHPIESSWLAWGPTQHNSAEQEQREAEFADLTRWLLFGLIDFDFISESMLAAKSSPGQKGKQLVVGRMKYDAVIVPNLRTIRATTLRRLERFARAGGRVIFAGGVPPLVEASPSVAPAKLAKRFGVVPWVRTKILEAVEPFRDVQIRLENGAPADSILCQLRSDSKSRHLFLCNTDRAKPRRNARIAITGKWNAIRLDTLSGDAEPFPAQIEGGRTTVLWSFDAHGHLLLTLKPAGKIPAVVPPRSESKWSDVGRLDDPVRVTLSEPNVLLLDQATWRLDGGAWRPREEMLRLDNLVREQLKLPLRSGKAAQPWADRSPAPVVAQLQLRIPIRSDVHVGAPLLAVEEARSLKIHFDGRPVPADVAGWWVDEAIETVRLPSFAAGQHELMLTIPFTRKTNVEWCYLLGNFGVSVAGRDATIVAPVRTLAFGDWTHQGLPFYAGNVTYHCSIDGDGRAVLLEAAKIKSPLLSVNLDGQPAGKIAFAPFQLNFGALSPGAHALDLTAFGNRVNAFGPLHHTNEDLRWVGPPAWRSIGNDWTYGYVFKRMGILVAPTIKAAAAQRLHTMPATSIGTPAPASA